MKSLLVNWKTTLAGVGAGLTAAGHLATALSNGDTSSLMSDGALIIAAAGVLFAKDGNVTGGTTKQ